MNSYRCRLIGTNILFYLKFINLCVYIYIYYITRTNAVDLPAENALKTAFLIVNIFYNYIDSNNISDTFSLSFFDAKLFANINEYSFGSAYIYL